MGKILVTGGAGYIGSHIVRDLGLAGYNPVVYDNLCMGNKDYLLCGDFVQGDLEDTALLTKVIRDYNIKSVIHFAAFIQVEESVQNPLKYYENNSVNAIKLINVCLAENIENFVFSSTAAVYGMPETVPITEDMVMNPINPYGKSKVVTEMVLKDVSEAHPGFNYIALRYFNVAGADKDARIGQNYPKVTHLMTLALRAASGERKGLKVFGTDYDTPDGSAIRDYIHVDDLATAHLLALDYLKTEKNSRIFNCGYGNGLSVRQVIRAAKEVTGIDFPVEDADRRAGDPPQLIADSSLIQNELGWKPQYNDIHYIVKTAWEWEKKLKGI